MRKLLIPLFALSLSAQASTVATEKFVCPVGGEKFTAQMAMSGTAFGQYLDFKPYGPIFAPPPLPVCPGNKLVMYKTFSPAEVVSLTAFLKSGHYLSKDRKHSPYYLAARLMRHLDEPQEKIARALLMSTWEADEPALYQEYAAEALKAFGMALEGNYDSRMGRLNDEVVAGELERRLGRFDEAGARFERLSREDLQPYHRKWIALQLQLIAQKSTLNTEAPTSDR
jgi:hypothetical protein